MKKRVLYFIPEFPRLSETFIEREVSKLIELGNLDITIFSMVRASGAMDSHVEKVTNYERLTLSAVIKASLSYILLNPIQIYHAHKLILGEDRVPYLFPRSNTNVRTRMEDSQSVLGKFHRSRFIQFLKGIAYAKLFEKHKPDHIHCHFLSESSTLVMIAARILGIPFSISAHAKDVWVENSLVKSKAKTAKFISVCNGNTWAHARYLAGEKYQSKVHLLFHGVDSDKMFGGKPKMKKRDFPMVLCIASRFVPKKGLEYLVEASKILQSKGIDHEIHLIGQRDPYNNYYEKILKLIEDAGLQNVIIVHGGGNGLPNTEVAEFFKVADIFTLPAVVSGEGDVDGVPTVVIEASLAKVPTVTTDAGSITDLITNETGILVQQHDAKHLAVGLEKLILEPSTRKKLGNAAYNKAYKMFNLDINIKELESLILE